MASLAALRKQAKDAGVPKAAILAATTAEELQSVLADHAAHDGGTKAPAKKNAVAKKKSSKASAPQKKQNRAVPQKKNSNSSGRTSAPAKSAKGTAKRRATATKKKSNGNSGYVPKGGRNLLDSVDFGVTEGWNPRKGSAPDRIIAAVRKARGNRAKAFEALKPDVWDFVGKEKRNGQKRTKDEAYSMLRYRVSRTLFDFAVATGQHEIAKNRVQYGTGGTGQGIWKPAKARKAAKATPKRATAKKVSQSRAGASTRKAARKRMATKASSRRK